MRVVVPSPHMDILHLYPSSILCGRWNDIPMVLSIAVESRIVDAQDE